MKNCLIIAFAFTTSVMLVGCNTPKTRYQWGDYQPEVYHYFKGASVEQQIIVLEKNLDEFKAQGALIPPGFYAHLGMLYSTVGQIDPAINAFMMEKKLFPESAPYMDFLLNNTKKMGQ